MSMLNVFQVAGSALHAQSLRLNTTASNLANADSVSGDPRTVYKARHPVFTVAQNAPGAPQGEGSAVQVAGIVESNKEPVKRYDPGNPLADAQGYVYSPGVNVVEEMVDMISASRSYQNDVEVVKTARDLMLATLRLGQ